MNAFQATAVPSAKLASALSAVVLLCAAWWAAPCLASAPYRAQASLPGANIAQAGRPGASRVAPAPAPRASRRPTKPLWGELTPAQHQALAPLAAAWDTVSETQKRKWLALSQNFPLMSGAEQVKLHSRMTEWASLSPQQRTQARLNFGETRQLAPDDKKAKWEAYQALSPEEKRKLAAKASKPPATAAAVKPVAPDKLAVVPKPRPRQQNKPARIAAAPNQVDHNTLLPQQAPPGPGPIN